MDEKKDQSLKIGIICIAIWIIGLWVGREILAQTGSLYPMIDAETPNPDYDISFHKFIVYVEMGWTAVCIALGYFWTKSTK